MKLIVNRFGHADHEAVVVDSEHAYVTFLLPSGDGIRVHEIADGRLEIRANDGAALVIESKAVHTIHVSAKEAV